MKIKDIKPWAKNIVSAIKGQSVSLTDSDGLMRLSRYFGFGSNLPQWLTLNGNTDYVKAWEQCPPVVSVICGKASADSNGKIHFVYTPDNEGNEESVNLSRVAPARALQRLFAKPNPLQTWRQFRAQQKIYTQLFGYCPVLMVRPAGFKNRVDTKYMWNIPPHLLTIKTTGKLYAQADTQGIIESIELRVGGKTTLLPVEDVLFLRDQYLSLDQEILPDSRIRSLQYPISNVVVSYEASNVLISKRGALGILANVPGKDEFGPVDNLRPEDKKQLQEDFQKYGLSADQYQVIITNASLRWQQMAMPVKELQIFETIADATRQICDVYGYAYELLSKEKGDTFSNKREAKASLYQDTIIPEAQADFEAYNEYFGLTETNYRMLYDFSHVEVLQKSQKEEAEVKEITGRTAEQMFNAGAIHRNRMREMLGEQTVAGDDKYVWEVQQEQANPDQNPNDDNKQTAKAAKNKQPVVLWTI